MFCQDRANTACVCIETWSFGVGRKNKTRGEKRADKRHKFAGFVRNKMILMGLCARQKRGWFGEELCGL